jgi:translation initiation factor 2B subunit (eIF-2B alpha/beta/delta family)
MLPEKNLHVFILTTEYFISEHLERPQEVRMRLKKNNSTSMKSSDLISTQCQSITSQILLEHAASSLMTICT